MDWRGNRDIYPRVVKKLACHSGLGYTTTMRLGLYTLTETGDKLQAHFRDARRVINTQ